MEQSNKQEKAKVFAMYLMCEVIGEWDGERKGILTGIHGEYEAEIQFYEEDGVNVFENPEYNEYDKCKLLLTSLLEISNEDLVKIFTICYHSVYDHMPEITDAIFITGRNGDKGMKWSEQVNNKKWDYGLTIDENGETLFSADGSFLTIPLVQIIDTLREMGYALPYKGQSLFELNLAIPKSSIDGK